MCFFSHDSNAQFDPKIVALRRKLGWRGYGLFWALIEQLNLTDDCSLEANFEEMAWLLREKADVIKKVVCDFGLFEFEADGARFYSPSSRRRKDMRNAKARAVAEKMTESRRAAGLASAKARAEKKSIEKSVTSESSSPLFAPEPFEASNAAGNVDFGNVENKGLTNVEKTTLSITNSETASNETPKIAPEPFEASNAVDYLTQETFSKVGEEIERRIETERSDWNEIFASTPNVLKSPIVPTSIVGVNLRESLDAYSRDELRAAFDEAKRSKFPWTFRSVVKHTNIQKLLVEREKRLKNGPDESVAAKTIQKRNGDGIDFDAMFAVDPGKLCDYGYRDGSSGS